MDTPNRIEAHLAASLYYRRDDVFVRVISRNGSDVTVIHPLRGECVIDREELTL
jgi:hypothetical protein